MSPAVRIDPHFAELLAAERARRHAAIVQATEGRALLLLSAGVGEAAAYAQALQEARHEMAKLNAWFDRAVSLAGALER